MPRYEKWLHAATSDSPSDEVARSALTERLLAVSYFLKKAIGSGDEAEAIHQLRVWTRRSSTALEFFKPGLPRSRCDRMLKTLHKLRHTAGEVRDCDIQRNRLQNADPDISHSAIRSLKKDRRRARKRFKQLRHQLRHKDRLNLQIEKLLAHVAWPKRHSSRATPPFATLCRQQLAPLAGEFFSRAKANLRNLDNLHQLRIAGKRLRYALELAVAVLPPRPLRQFYQALNQAQDRLGVVCDERAFLDSVLKWLSESKKNKARHGLEELLKPQKTRVESAHKKLLRWWSPTLMRRFRGLWKAIS